MKPILEARSLSKSFLLNEQPRLILKDASLSLSDGEFVSIIGSSGCGKSTFLELLAGVTMPDQGRIIHQGEDITGQSGKLGYMPQEDLLFPWLSVRDNALLPARILKQDLSHARTEINELLPIFGLAEHADHLPWQLSGGLRQRTAFLRTCMTRAKILLLDEPFASLDAITRKQLQSWLKDIALRLGLSIILVTHDILEALSLSTRLVLMKGSPGSFDKTYNLTNNSQDKDALMAEITKDLLSA